MRPQGVRIIAGEWRGRRLKVPPIEGLRPTPDRVRETVFNWLAQKIPGSRCLDLFAGSGAFGFEALSRGAAYVEMVDQSAEVIQLLQNELRQFNATQARIYQALVPKQLHIAEQPFNIVFLDPPYGKNLLIPCSHFLEDKGYLADPAYIYLEAREAVLGHDLPSTWRLIKSRKAGQVFYHLAYRES
jgi:16S rRNA (guanine966-N2)-methyltransferase